MDTVGIQIKTPFINIDDLPVGTKKVSLIVDGGISFIRCYDINGKKIDSIIQNEETKAYTPSERINFSEDGIDYEELLAMGVDKEELDSLIKQNS